MFKNTIKIQVADVDDLNRQETIKKSSSGQPLIVRHSPTNEHPELVTVYTQSGYEIGNLYNAKLANALNNGKTIFVFITKIFESPEKPNIYECIIKIKIKCAPY